MTNFNVVNRLGRTSLYTINTRRSILNVDSVLPNDSPSRVSLLFSKRRFIADLTGGHSLQERRGIIAEPLLEIGMRFEFRNRDAVNGWPGFSDLPDFVFCHFTHP